MKTLLVSCVCSSLFLVGCSGSQPAAPLAPTPSTTVSIAAPSVVTPVLDEQWGWLEQPVVLTVTNAVVTGTSTTPVTYEFDLATDAAFTAIVSNQKGIVQGVGRTTASIPQISAPKILFWRARATNGTVTSAYSPAIAFELEGQGGHISSSGYEDPGGNPLSEEYALAIINGCGDEFPDTLAVYGSDEAAELKAEELLLRVIWHLKLVGFDAARQRNPSGAISRDKLNIYIRGTWRNYDIFSLGVAGRATTITGLGHVGAENPQFNDGIPD